LIDPAFRKQQIYRKKKKNLPKYSYLLFFAERSLGLFLVGKGFGNISFYLFNYLFIFIARENNAYRNIIKG